MWATDSKSKCGPLRNISCILKVDTGIYICGKYGGDWDM